MKDEKQLISDMLDLMVYMTERDNAKGDTHRATHLKCTGLLKSKFIVRKDIPEEFKIGVFKQPIEYDAWIRFANAASFIRSDNKNDIRSLSIKLLNVEGERYLNEKTSQDFLLQSDPTMPIGTLKDFRDAIYYIIKYNRAVAAFVFLFTGRLKQLLGLAASEKKHNSPLYLNYWSQTPYQLGKFKVKYKICPTSENKIKLPKKLTYSSLTDNMVTHINNHPATFDFYIQLFKDEDSTPIEDAAVEWNESISPLIKLGEIHIPIQKFNTEERSKLQRLMTFDLANVLKDHEPIGGLNRARTQIYYKMAEYRSSRDNTPLIEPSFEDYD